MEPPVTSSAPPTSGYSPTWPRAPRSLAMGRGVEWWSEGWRVFTAAPLIWIGVIVVLAIAMLVLQIVPLIGQLAQLVLWPVFLGGLVLGCLALARGQRLEFMHLFAGFRDGPVGALVILGLIAVAFGFALALVVGVFAFGAVGMTGLEVLMRGDAAAMQRAIAGAGVGALIALPIVILGSLLFMMAWWFATPLVSLNRAQPMDALKASFDASWKNIGALIVFVLIYLVLAIVATIPFGLGWLVLGPVAIGANFASWREVFGD
ncbi:MAG TPA: BPSS1780 family membrane protein [Casimicrobiaceae bacterium]|nr:BPSS1780 family membrane protein [Casimicrobiaceae bacterium]